jgi:hypothetical protein
VPLAITVCAWAGKALKADMAITASGIAKTISDFFIVIFFVK